MKVTSLFTNYDRARQVVLLVGLVLVTSICAISQTAPTGDVDKAIAYLRQIDPAQVKEADEASARASMLRSNVWDVHAIEKKWESPQKQKRHEAANH